MATNLYAKCYRTESRTQKDEEFAFISYMDEPNSFSVVSMKRLVDVDSFGKGHIREKNKNYRINVERTGKHRLCRSFSHRLITYNEGTLSEMEKIANEAEEASSYKMNTDVVSDTEEWHKRKKVENSKNKKQISKFS